ncbi:hypothetical protein VP464E531_P0076 [Vibrio phage 464E53-1]|nr:hypothetical protein VP464E531_P0076 [Vibrio phage 464E53-1]
MTAYHVKSQSTMRYALGSIRGDELGGVTV